MFAEALKSGLRFPIHDFIIHLLANAKVNPCQLTPNSWKMVHVFMVSCHLKKIPLSVLVFRAIFMFKNSPSIR